MKKFNLLTIALLCVMAGCGEKPRSLRSEYRYKIFDYCSKKTDSLQLVFEQGRTENDANKCINALNKQAAYIDVMRYLNESK